MELDLYGYVVRELNARGRDQWAAISDGSGVPQSTLEKIAYLVTTNPSVHAVQKLANFLMNESRPPEQHVAQRVGDRQQG